MLQIGIGGHAPTVVIKPIERVSMTVAALRKALEQYPPDALVVLEDGPVNKIHKVQKFPEVQEVMPAPEVHVVLRSLK
jgi:hypothetical protein